MSDAYAEAAAPLPASGGQPRPVQPAERIGVLDVLRGIALLGMFVAHFHDNTKPSGTGFDPIYGKFVELFIDGRLATMFAILFGVGFAVQLRRADARGDRFSLRYLRRLLALCCFGVIAEGVFGYNVLLDLALWGLPLLLVQRWSNRSLVILASLCVLSEPIYDLSWKGLEALKGHPEQFEAKRGAMGKQSRIRYGIFWRARDSTTFRAAVATRMSNMPAFNFKPFLPGGEFVLFLIGLLALRRGVLEDPGRHRRLILFAMLLGGASWAGSTWLWTWYFPAHMYKPPFLSATLASVLFAILNDRWLAITYIGAILLLVARDPGWIRKLGAFGITGRMALTNYMLQVMLLDLTFAKYGLGAHVSMVYAPVAALALFGIQWGYSRWWLSRFQYGPLEWVWRSATYARWQPLRRMAA
jgi:uncharacterized protein